MLSVKVKNVHSIIVYSCLLFFYRSPPLIIDSQSNKIGEEGKFETENRRRTDKLLKKQYGLKPVDNWRKHKKALNAAKYFEELPPTEKAIANPEPKVPLVETKPDSKVLKTVKSNKKISISLPLVKQINSLESPTAALNSPPPQLPSEVMKKPIASVAPYQIVLPKQLVVQPERLVEKPSTTKSKPIQPEQNKIEKEPATTIRPVLSKKSISDDDGLLTEYKYTKKKTKSERKALLSPPTPPVVVKPKVQPVERFNPPEVNKQKVQTVERFNSPELKKSKIQSVERFSNSFEVTKTKVSTVENIVTQETIKSKDQSSDKCIDLSEGSKARTVEECDSPDASKQNNGAIVTEKEKKDIVQSYKLQVVQQIDAEKKITVLKRGSENSHTDQPSNKHGNY